MLKYRIKELKGKFYPQYRKLFWWRSYLNSQDDSICFQNLGDAIECLEGMCRIRDMEKAENKPKTKYYTIKGKSIERNEGDVAIIILLIIFMSMVLLSILYELNII